MTERLRTNDIEGDASSFRELILPEELLSALSSAGFKRPSPVQYEAIPLARLGADLIVQVWHGVLGSFVLTPNQWLLPGNAAVSMGHGERCIAALRHLHIDVPLHASGQVWNRQDSRLRCGGPGEHRCGDPDASGIGDLYE